MAEDLEQNIRDNAAGPKRAQSDSVSVEQHDLRDQIEADRYLSLATGEGNEGTKGERGNVGTPIGNRRANGTHIGA